MVLCGCVRNRNGCGARGEETVGPGHLSRRGLVWPGVCLAGSGGEEPEEPNVCADVVCAKRKTNHRSDRRRDYVSMS